MSFTTVIYLDLTPPQISGFTLADNPSGVATDIQIEVQFSEPLLESTLTVSNFSLLDGSDQVKDRTFEVEESTLRFTPAAPLTHFRDYRISIGTGITDLNWNALDSSYQSSFQTLGSVVISPVDGESMILLSGGTFQMGAVN